MNTNKINQQLLFLFLSNFAILFTGMGLFPILPIYAAQFGANTEMVGMYMAITYISITAGTLLTGWLAARIQRKRLFLAAGLAGIPALLGMGLAVNFTQVVVLTGVVWFTGGIGLALVNVFAGLAVDSKKRGKAFSLLALASPVAALFGGFFVGRLVTWYGYPLMFIALAVVWVMWPVLAAWKIEENPGEPTTGKGPAVTARESQASNHLFAALLAGILLSAVTVSVGRLGISLMMKSQAFSLSAISSTSMASGLMAMPIIALTGSAADRWGHRRVLVLGYLVAAAGTLILIFANQLWHFWAAAVLLLVALNGNRSLAAATAAGVLTPDELAHKLPWTATANWMAGIIGYAATGFVIEAIGIRSLFSLAALFSLASALLVLAPTLTIRPLSLWQTAAHSLAGKLNPTSQPCQEG